MDMIRFESRTAKVNYSPEVVYRFASDIRNFRRFISSDTFSDIDFREDSCSFRVNPVGPVSIRLKEKIMFSRIVFSGNAILQNDFDMILSLQEVAGNNSEIRLAFEADMNPLLRMAASEPLNKFLDTLVSEMEKFRGWNDISEDTQAL
jgi:hypothetical protein